MASEHSHTSGSRPTRAALTALIVALVAAGHAGVCYLVLVRAVPPVTIIAVAVALLAAGIAAVFRHSWQGRKTVAGWLLVAATTTLALAFVTTAVGGPVSAGNQAVRVVVKSVSVPTVPGPVVLVGFEDGAGREVTQFGQVVAVGYALLAAALWVLPGVGSVGDRIVDSL